VRFCYKSKERGASEKTPKAQCTLIVLLTPDHSISSTGNIDKPIFYTEIVIHFECTLHAAHVRDVEVAYERSLIPPSAHILLKFARNDFSAA
jgi:hypothetical protein